MFSLWARIIDEDDKIIMQDVFEFKQDFVAGLLKVYLTIIANKFKIETPIVLTKHAHFMQNFNIIKFVKEDFIDKVNFKALILELM